MSTASVNTGAATNPDATEAPEGHDEKMVAAYEESQQAAAGTDTSTAESEEDGDEKILGKFESQDQLIEAYRSLEAKLSQGTQAQGESEQGDSTGEPEGGEQERTQAAEEAVEKAEGVDMDSLSKEYFEKGDLAAESYEALEKAGIPRQMVEEYIQGQEARANQYQDQALQEVGGEEEFAKISEWAASNLSGEQIERYNSAVGSDDPARMQEAVKALAFEYGRARPSEPGLLGGGNNHSAGDRFDSVAQLTEAMSDPRYQNDPAFRKEVEQKLSRSNVM
jgi:hypothetical protein